MEPSGTMLREKGRRLVLGFDAGCATCSDVAKRIEEAVGDELEVRGLHDPQVEHWREQALGKDAPWAPTLIEIKAGKVRAWTGLRIGVRLGLCLGPGATWRIMQILGGEDPGGSGSPTGDRDIASLNRKSVTRGQFIKGAVGAATAVSVLSGALASPATAREKGIPKSIGHRDLEGEELGRIARSVASRKDVTNVTNSSWSRKVRTGRIAKARANGHDIDVIANGGNPSVRTTEVNVSVSGDGIVVKAAKHDIQGGNGLLAVVYMAGNQIVSYYEFDEPTGGVKSKAQVWEVEQEKATVVLQNESQNGVLNAPVPRSEGRSFQVISCGGCNSSRRRRRVRVCNSVSYRCLIINCGICLIGAPGVLKLACVYIYCPFLLYCGAGTCCKAGGCGYACAGCAR